MKTHTHRGLGTSPPSPLHKSSSLRPSCAPPLKPLRDRFFRQYPTEKRRRLILSVTDPQYSSTTPARRHVLLAPFLTTCGWVFQSALARAEDKPQDSSTPEKSPLSPTVVEKMDDIIVSRIYDATVIGEPTAVGKNKSKVWEKLMNARIVYLGEAEHVPILDDKELELEIVRNLTKRCTESDRRISLALEAFPLTFLAHNVCNISVTLKHS